MNTITTYESFLAHALAIEEEATERYAVFAEQMETTNNPEVAKLFREMERIEGEHARSIRTLAGESPLPRIEPWELDWGDGEAPEAIDYSATHYLMTPYQALTLVLKAEHRAVEFFAAVAAGDAPAEVRRLAAEFAAEEREHVVMVTGWRERYPPPEPDWDHDPDPPNEIE